MKELTSNVETKIMLGTAAVLLTFFGLICVFDNTQPSLGATDNAVNRIR